MNKLLPVKHRNVYNTRVYDDPIAEFWRKVRYTVNVVADTFVYNPLASIQKRINDRLYPDVSHEVAK